MGGIFFLSSLFSEELDFSSLEEMSVTRIYLLLFIHSAYTYWLPALLDSGDNTEQNRFCSVEAYKLLEKTDIKLVT